MNVRPLLAFAVMGLCACSTAPEPHEAEFEMEIKSVELPASVLPDAPMNVVVEVTVGGCIRYKRMEVISRTANRLELKAIGTAPTEAIPCPANLGWQKVTYTDAGTPARVNPFEVVVNGKSWGTVTIP